CCVLFRDDVPAVIGPTDMRYPLQREAILNGDRHAEQGRQILDSVAPQPASRLLRFLTRLLEQRHNHRIDARVDLFDAPDMRLDHLYRIQLPGTDAAGDLCRAEG